MVCGMVERTKETFLYGYRNDFDRKQLIQKFNNITKKEIIEIQTLICKNITKKKKIVDLFSQCIYDKNKLNIEEINTKYTNEFLKIDAKCLGLKQWDDLRIISICNGMFSISHIFRQKAKEKALSSMFFHNIIPKLLCLIEDNKLYESKKIINSFYCKIFLHKNKLKEINEYIDALNNKILCNDSFYSYIKLKDMIVIGPGPNEKEINNIDLSKTVITRVNYFGYDSIPKINSKIKTNISYYSSSTNPKFMTNNFDENEIDYMCGKSNFENLDKKRIMHGHGHIIPFGNANMIQRILIDMLYYQYSNVYITNVNLYASKKRYSNEYISSENDSLELAAMAGHDIEGNYIFMHNYYNNKRYLCDETLSTILDDGLNEYLLRLDNTFN